MQDLAEGAKPRDLLAGTQLLAGEGIRRRRNLERRRTQSGLGARRPLAGLRRHARPQSRRLCRRASASLPGARRGRRAARSHARRRHLRQAGLPSRRQSAARHVQPRERQGLQSDAPGELQLAGYRARTRVLTATSDRSVTSYAIASDSGAVYFLAEDAGLEKLYAVGAAGGDVRAGGHARARRPHQHRRRRPQPGCRLGKRGESGGSGAHRCRPAAASSRSPVSTPRAPPPSTGSRCGISGSPARPARRSTA